MKLLTQLDLLNLRRLPLVLLPTDLFIGHLSIRPNGSGQEADPLQLVLEVLQGWLYRICLCFWIERDCSRHLVVRPVPW